MRDVLLGMANLIMWYWFGYVATLTLIPWTRTVQGVHGILRIVCPLALASYVVAVILAPPMAWYIWPIYIVWPFTWLGAHRKLCQHKHGRRFFETARGWVRRRGNRLAIIPETAS